MAQEAFTCIERWLQDNKVFVCYRTPQSNILHCLVQNNDDVYTTQTLTEEGFVMAPFDRAKENVFIPKAQSRYTSYTLDNNNLPTTDHSAQKISTDPAEQQRHMSLVQKTVDYISSGQAQKIVISRRVEQTMPSDNSVDVFKNLIAQYPEAMVYLWHHPKVGFWMGATPERLLTIDRDDFSTMALAGTQPYSESLTWQDKEIEEQAIVTRYIVESIKDDSKSLSLSDTYTKKAGPLAHLCTDISGQFKSQRHFKPVVDKLHPTPAVCGVPQDVAQNFIINNEGYDRLFYTGYLGYIHPNHTSELFVNLRCMQILTDKAVVYVGGGITADSIPENEWLETVEKSKVLLSVF